MQHAMALFVDDRGDCATCWKTLILVSHIARCLAPVGVSPSERLARPWLLTEGLSWSNPALPSPAWHHSWEVSGRRGQSSTRKDRGQMSQEWSRSFQTQAASGLSKQQEAHQLDGSTRLTYLHEAGQQDPEGDLKGRAHMPIVNAQHWKGLSGLHAMVGD